MIMMSIFDPTRGSYSLGRVLLRRNTLYNLLRTPHKESMDLSDEFYLTTGYEPNGFDSKKTSVEPCTELLDSPPFFSDKGFPMDSDYDDAALEGMLREAHRVHSHHSQREDLSVSLSSSVSDRTGRLVGDRAGRPAEQSNQESQMRTLLDKQKRANSCRVPSKNEQTRISSRLRQKKFTKIG